MTAVVDQNALGSSLRTGVGRAGWIRAIGGLPAVVVAFGLVALAVGVDPTGARPFTSLRWALVSTAVAGASLAVQRWDLPRWHLAAWGLVLAGMALGAAAGPDSTTAWLGHPQRHLGVFAWTLFALAAAAGAALAGRIRALRTVEIIVVVVAGNIAATSIADRLGWDPAGISFPGDRIGGVFGQPVVLGAVGVLLVPMVVACRRVGGVRWPIAGGLLVAIALSQTRGAVLGLVAIVAVTAPTWARTLSRLGSGQPARPHERENADQSERGAGQRRRWLVATAGVGVMALAAVVTISPVGERLADTGDSSRPDEWALALSVIADSPLVGVGPEGYRVAVLDHLDDAYVDRYGRDVVVDRAHAAPLDVAASGGIVAGVAYLALIGSVAVATWRRQRVAGQVDPMVVAAGAGAVGVFAAGLVAFPVPEVDAVAWLFAGLALATPRGLGPGTASRPAWALRVVAAAAVVVAVGAGATDVVADHHMGDALMAAADGRTAAAHTAAQRAVDLRPDLVDAHYVAASAAATGPTILDLDRALDAVETGLARFPSDPALRDLHVTLLVDRAVRSELGSDVTAAVRALEDLERTDPTSLVVESGTARLHEACLTRCENTP